VSPPRGEGVRGRSTLGGAGRFAPLRPLHRPDRVNGPGPGPEGIIQAGNRHDRPHVQDGVDDEDAQALWAEGLDPDDPAVVAAIDPVRWELSLLPGF
jgi:hypothetical protein